MSHLCESHVAQVVVHARGALITRRVVPPPVLPDGDVDLIIPGLTPLCEPGSVRAQITGTGRAVVSVKAAISVPASPAIVGKTLEEVRALTARIERLRAEQAILSTRHRDLSELCPALTLRTTSLHERPDTRAEDALFSSALIDDLLKELDGRILALSEEIREREREREAAALAEAQQSTTERNPGEAPTRCVTVRLTGTGCAGEMLLSYVVPAARWWPVYMLRLSDGGKRAAWWLEALVAQISGEDWRGVRVALSTADLIYDARLPELPSLRLSKAQPPPRRGYRPLPPGLSLMFAGYDRAFPQGTTGPRRNAPPSSPLPPPSPSVDLDDEGAQMEWRAEPTAHGQALSSLADRLDDEATGRSEIGSMNYGMAEGGAPDKLAQEYSKKRSGGRSGGPPGGMPGRMPLPSAPPSLSRAAPQMAPAPAPMAARGKGSPMVMATASMSRALTLGGGGGAPMLDGMAPEAPEPEPDLTPGDAWLDFDALRLGQRDDRARRGKLYLEQDGAFARQRQQAISAIDSLSPPHPVTDPRDSRGVFDHRYEADGVADVPSDGQVHRLMIGSAETTPTLRFRTVPRDAPEVFREVELQNPFDAPLLAGPVDVYSEGSLLLTASVSGIDRGGTMQVGMGVEERLRVARNVRVEEQSAGMLGGSTLVTHAVSLELSSALSAAVTVEVLEVLPVSDDKSVEIERLPGKPEPVPYKQAERGAAVRGGQKWTLLVPAGGKVFFEHRYRLTIPAKYEIVGGNRRE